MTAYSTLIISDSPFAYYMEGEASGTSATDTSGNGYTATISGSGITYGQTGPISGDATTALLFDGSHGKITTPGGVSVVGWGQMTVEAWVKLTNNTSGKGTIWATGTTPTNTGDGFKFWIGANGTNGGLAIGVSGNRWSQALFNQTFTAGVWYYIAGTWDGTTIRLYVNPTSSTPNGSTGTVSGSIDSTGFAVTIGQDPQAGGDYFSGTMGQAAIYSAQLSAGELQEHYAAGLAQIAPNLPQPSFITNAPGNVLLLINDVWYPTIRSETINIARAVADPIQTFTFDLQDDPSHIPLSELQEVVFIDAGQIANPTHNLLANPALNPYNTTWATSAHSGLTLSQNGGGGLTITAANAAVNTYFSLSQSLSPGALMPGQSYMLSATVQGASTPTAIGGFMELAFLDPVGNVLGKADWFGVNPAPTTAARFFVSGVAPAGTYTIKAWLGISTSNATNSGAIIYTQVQLEPMCFTTGTYQLSYPTPWCAAGQTNCFLLPDGSSVRQLRLFGGYITKATAGPYVGNTRRWSVTVSGYAWLLQKQLLNNTWTAENDSDIIANIVLLYFSTTFSTAQVASGAPYQATLAYTYNGTARDAFDALAANSNFIYYVDAYRTIWYQPPGYNTLAFALSDEPDHLTSFEYFSYTRDFDATQLANVTYVTGATGVAWLEYDAQSIATYANKTGGTGQYWRTVSDSGIASNAAAQSRAIGETTQFNYARPILHLSTNQFMVPGYTVLFTSGTDGLSQAVFLVQKATLVLYGFVTLFKALYECQCDLGYFNPDLTNVLSKVLRWKAANNTAPGPAYYGPIPAPAPGIGVMATEQMNFRDTVQVTVTSTTTIGGVATTWYGTAGATYGNSLVGYG